MEILIWVLGIAWLIVSAVNKKKRQQAQAEAARKQAQEAADVSAPTPQSPVPAQRTILDAPVRQAPSKAFDPYFLDTQDAPAPAKPVAPVKNVAAPVQSARRGPIDSSLEDRMLQTPQTRTRQAIGAQVHASSESRHALEASSISGEHIHTESSLSGVGADCPPVRAKANAVSHAAQRAAQPAAPVGAPFLWDVSETARGLVLAEILGKPKALQRRA